MAAASLRRVVILAPMPHEMDAIVEAFGLQPAGDAEGSPHTGRVGGSAVEAWHVGMGPDLTRTALTRLFTEAEASGRPVDHVMSAGICGGLGPDLPVGAVINPEFVIDHTSGASYRHSPPGDAPQAGKLMTTGRVILDPDVSREFLAQGCVAVDMESAAVAEVCEARGCGWSVHRCIGDRWFDGLLDPRVLAIVNPDGSGDLDALAELLAAEPDLAGQLDRLGADTMLAARRAAEAARAGCLALDG